MALNLIRKKEKSYAKVAGIFNRNECSSYKGKRGICTRCAIASQVQKLLPQYTLSI